MNNTKTPDVFSLSSKEAEVPINVGDALMVFRPGGELQTMTIGFDQDIVDGLKDKDIEDMTEEEIDMVEQGQTLYLLSMAYQSEVIMDLLRRVAQIPGENDIEKLNKAAMVH